MSKSSIGATPAWGGGTGARGFEQDFAAGHTLKRLFSVDPAWIDADARLAGLLGSGEPLALNLLSQYADSFDDVCAISGVPGSEGATTAELVGTVALITPGTGTIALPSGTNAVIIDLRGADPSADLAGAVSLALGDDVPLGTRSVQHFSGLPSHDDGGTHYESNLTYVAVVASGGGGEDLPLAFITPAQLGPKASTLVAGLRWMEAPCEPDSSSDGACSIASIPSSTWSVAASTAGWSRVWMKWRS